MKVDLKLTHGIKCKAADYLETALEKLNDERVNYNVHKIIRRTILSIKDLKKLDHVNFYARLVHADTKRYIETKSFPADIKNSLLNIIDTMYKENLYNRSQHLRKEKR